MSPSSASSSSIPCRKMTLMPALARYPKGIPLTWVQEEPLNMGAYPFIRLKFGELLREHWQF